MTNHKSKITNPKEIAIERASPMQADFPRPLAAVIATVARKVLSEMQSASLSRDLDWSSVQQHLRTSISGFVSANES